MTYTIELTFWDMTEGLDAFHFIFEGLMTQDQYDEWQDIEHNKVKYYDL